MVGILCHMTTEASAPTWIPSDATFGTRLAMVRQRMGWNQAEAARACGLPQTSWREWELEIGAPRNLVVIVKQIASAAGCDYLWLLAGPDGKSPEPTRRLPGHDRVVATVVRPAGVVTKTQPIVSGSTRTGLVHVR